MSFAIVHARVAFQGAISLGGARSAPLGRIKLVMVKLAFPMDSNGRLLRESSPGVMAGMVVVSWLVGIQSCRKPAVNTSIIRPRSEKGPMTVACSKPMTGKCVLSYMGWLSG